MYNKITNFYVYWNEFKENVCNIYIIYVYILILFLYQKNLTKNFLYIYKNQILKYFVFMCI
jgi:hypothetical protein